MELSRKKLNCILLLVILATAFVSAIVSWNVYVWAVGSKPSPDRALDDFPSSVSFKVDNDGAGTFWATMYNGSEVYYSLNGTDIAQAALNFSSAAGGGCVYVMPGAFSGAVVVPNRTRLVIESGATGLSFTVAAGAYCDVAIWNEPAHLYHYVAGTLSFDENLNAGTISSLSWLNSTSFSGSGQFWWNGQNRTDLLAYPQDSYNYLVFTIGGVVFAKTGNTAQVAVSTIQVCLDTLNNTGGSVIVKNGTYSEAVSLKNATRLVIDRGAFGVTVSISSGATAILEDYNLAITSVYSGGVLVMQYNNLNGAINGVWTTFTNGIFTNLNASYVFLGSLASDPISPVVGEMWYNSVAGLFKCYNGSTIILGSGTVGPAGPAGTISGLPFSYMIFNNATATYMISGVDGSIPYSSTNASQVINFALGNLTHTYPQTVVAMGDIVVDSPLEAYTNTTFINEGTISQPPNSNFKMFKNVDQVNGNTYIDVSGGKWFGGYNYTAFTSDVGLFDFRCTSLGSVTKNIAIHDLKVGASPNASIVLYNVVRADIHNVWQIAQNAYPYSAWADYRSFFYFKSVSDSDIRDCIGTSTQITFDFIGGSMNRIRGNYIAGGGYLGGVAWYMNGVNDNEISDNHIDYVYQGGIKFQDCQNNKINVLSVTSPNSNSYAAIEMASSYNSTFTNAFVGQPNSMSPGSSANTAYGWSYGIQETGDSGGNTYVAMTITNCTTAYALNAGSYIYSSTFNGKPIGSGEPYSYLVDVVDGVYRMKNGATGQIDFSSTNASQVGQNAIGNMTNGGILHFSRGNFTVNLVLTGADSYGLSDQNTIIIEGEGTDATTLYAATGNVIEARNSSSFVIRDLSIQYGSGDGFAGLVGSYSPNAPMSEISGVDFFGGSGTAWAIEWFNPNTPKISNVLIQAYGAGGIHLKQTSTTANFGNMAFYGNNLVNLQASNSIGMLIDASGGRELNMINSYGYFEVAPQGAYTNTTGIWAANLQYSNLQGLEFEGCSVGIYGAGCTNNWFVGNKQYSYLEGSGALISLTSAAYQNTFSGFLLCSQNGNCTAFQGGTTDPRYPNIFTDWTLQGGYGANNNINNTVTAASIVRNILKSDIGSGTYVGFSGSPVGVISSPAASAQIVDFGGYGVILNNTLYTIYGSSKNIYLTGGAFNGATYNCTVNGQVVFSNLATGPTMQIHLAAGDTLLFGWSSAPTIKVYGE